MPVLSLETSVLPLGYRAVAQSKQEIGALRFVENALTSNFADSCLAWIVTGTSANQNRLSQWAFEPIHSQTKASPENIPMAR